LSLHAAFSAVQTYTQQCGAVFLIQGLQKQNIMIKQMI